MHHDERMRTRASEYQGSLLLWLILVAIHATDEIAAFNNLQTRRIKSFRSSQFSNSDEGFAHQGIRINKVFRKTHSRRQAERLIASGRVQVNGRLISAEEIGLRVRPYQDTIQLDGDVVRGWEDDVDDVSDHVQHEYVKYWKPVGITCTMDYGIPGSLARAVEESGYHGKRIFPLGRLDKDSSGLLILTSDGRLPNAVLRSSHQKTKSYLVWTDHPVRTDHIEQLCLGVVITTEVARSGGYRRAVTARTLPCQVKVLAPRQLQMTLVEGRNRQIRNMLGTLGYRVLELHRTHFMGITLEGLHGPGDWMYLNRSEIDWMVECTT